MSKHSINICFTAGRSWISKVIRWVTRSPVSHCLITYRDQTLEKVMVMEADWAGFINKPWRGWKRQNEIVARFSIVAVSQNDQLDSLQKLSEYLGTKYDFWSLPAFLLRRFKNRFRNPLGKKNQLICSESVAIFLRDAGVDDFEHPNSWIPDDVYNYILENGDKFNREE